MTRGLGCPEAMTASTTICTSSSVSGRGTNAPGPTARTNCLKPRFPGDVLKRFARGTPADKIPKLFALII